MKNLYFLLAFCFSLVAMQPQIERRKYYDVYTNKLRDHLTRIFDQELSRAEEVKAAERINSLVSEGADPDVKIPDCKSTALHWAARRGFEGLMHTLLSKGANPNTIGENSKTPLMRLLQSPNAYEIRERLVLLLLENGADPKIGDGVETPLESAYIGYQWTGEKTIIDHLLVFGADYSVLSPEAKKDLEEGRNLSPEAEKMLQVMHAALMKISG